MNENLKLWNKVEKTNPKYTKKAKVGGNQITSISPQFQILNATEQFGSYGEKWGFRNIEFDYSITNTPINLNVVDWNTKETQVISSILGLVGFKATFFFPNGHFEITNSIKIFTDNKHSKIDDNFAKKLETDALTKALSKLGFNADIFLGKFDDVRYVQDVTKEFNQIELEKNKLTDIEIENISIKIKNSKQLSELSVIFKSDYKINNNSVLKSLLSAKRKEIEVSKEESERFLDFIKGISTKEQLSTAMRHKNGSIEPYKAMIKLQEIKLNKK
tara:strand:+ start:5898 stop:6719 length:822 start_codon:yes stop_codon:yes gene_type:complete